MSEDTTLWDEFDAMAYNLRQQAHSGVHEREGRAMLDVAQRIESVLKRFPNKPAPELEVAGEIRPGRGYLLSVDKNITMEQAKAMNDKLAERFPESRFAILAPGVKLPGGDNLVTVDGLLAAIQRAGEKLQLGNAKATADTSRVAYAGAWYALRELRDALAPERAGSGAPPAASPGESAAAESAIATPDPAPIKMGCTCAHINVDSSADVPGTRWITGHKDPECDLHGYLDRRLRLAGKCGMRHEHWRDMACTTLTDHGGTWHIASAEGWIMQFKREVPK